MFKRVLIAEDHESTSISVRKTLEDLGIPKTEYTYYCDDAFMHIQKSLGDDQPFDLLITDLSFEEDHRKQKLSGGLALIEAIKQIQPLVKILVFSAETNPAIIDNLFKNLCINGYVRKARHDAKDLKKALENIAQYKTYLSEDLRHSLKQKNTFEFTEYDVTIISLLSQGTPQKDIPTYLLHHKIKPASLSSLEKRLGTIKDSLEFSKNEQLVAYCKDLGII
ncbi:response regulator [Pedobacter sp. MC2016-05]|uniref:response regulator n=1 Tax=Pedobacter sp. MC2016-05 TaxID=2994474 RepID=UPI002247BAF0|nr:response regulator [Pedobacter sp. MC2016-05]MCX2472712.1 response regulator [Pedobacter sp. MC2016-05]